MSRDIAPFGVRMPSDLKQKIENSAKKSGRSMNAEIVHRLEQSFKDKKILQFEDSIATNIERGLELEKRVEAMNKKLDLVLAGTTLSKEND